MHPGRTRCNGQDYLPLEVQNLLNTQWWEAQFETTSRIGGEGIPVDDISFTPGTPIFAKVRLGIFF
jgi:hypothetical protein